MEELNTVEFSRGNITYELEVSGDRDFLVIETVTIIEGSPPEHVLDAEIFSETLDDDDWRTIKEQLP